jgi:hypothetical protein
MGLRSTAAQCRPEGPKLSIIQGNNPFCCTLQYLQHIITNNSFDAIKKVCHVNNYDKQEYFTVCRCRMPGENAENPISSKEKE